MFKTDVYIPSLIELLKDIYHERLHYVGLQGSYLRGEATDHSDIDIMVVISNISVTDLDEYQKAISSLEDYDKSCGFIHVKATSQGQAGLTLATAHGVKYPAACCGVFDLRHRRIAKLESS